MCHRLCRRRPAPPERVPQLSPHMRLARSAWDDSAGMNVAQESSGILPRIPIQTGHMKSKQEQGFTLIELLIVVAIISIIAAIAVPGLLRARMTGNETSAIASLKVVTSSQVAYSASCGNGGYAATFVDPRHAWRPARPRRSSRRTSARSAAPQKSGYNFTLGAGAGRRPVRTIATARRPDRATTRRRCRRRSARRARARSRSTRATRSGRSARPRRRPSRSRRRRRRFSKRFASHTPVHRRCRAPGCEPATRFSEERDGPLQPRVVAAAIGTRREHQVTFPGWVVGATEVEAAP